MSCPDPLANVLLRIAELNAQQFRANGELPATLIIGPRRRQDGFEVLPLEAITLRAVQHEIADACLTITCLEGHLMEQRRDEAGRFPTPDPDTIADNPDARRCYVYLAQTIDGTRACAVQYVLRPEHGSASLAPLKILTDHNVAIADADLADLARPGRRAPRSTH